MKLHNRFSILALIAAASLAFTACDDGDDNPPVETCEQNPAQDKCEQPVTCEEDPTQEKCAVDCEATPDAEGCTVTCEEDPEAEGCAVDCEANPEAEGCPIDCTEEAVADLIRTGLNFQETLFDFDDLEVTVDEGITTIKFDARFGNSADAKNYAWLYIDLNGATGPEILELTDEESLTNTAWDLAFKRTDIRLNSGYQAENVKFIALYDLGTDDFDAATTRPGQSTPFTTDGFVDTETCAVTADQRGNPLTAFGNWYDYDFTTHTVTSPQTVYALYGVTGHGQFYKLQIESIESSGIYTIRYGSL